MSRPLPSVALQAGYVCRQCRTKLLRQPIRTLTSSSSCQLQDEARQQPKKISNISNAAHTSTDDPAQQPPRWARTPAAMKAPYSVNPPNKNNEYPVNEDPVKLDKAISRMLGTEGGTNAMLGGGQVLDEEVKWLAVTHKSFDHGRRGFNDRLAFLGKRITELQTSLALLDAPQASSSAASSVSTDTYGRTPSKDAALEGIENLTDVSVANAIEKTRLADLAQRYGLHQVVRWKPRQINRLKASGIDTVLAHTIYAIVGAVALRRGGAAATSVVRERVLRPLGLLG